MNTPRTDELPSLEQIKLAWGLLTLANQHIEKASHHSRDLSRESSARFRIECKAALVFFSAATNEMEFELLPRAEGKEMRAP